MIARFRARILRDDAGLTLVEMIVVMLVTSVILLAIGGMYISTLQAQKTVSSLTGTTNSAQLVARSIDDGIRNGVEIRPLTAGADGGQLLLVCTAGANAAIDYTWQAWYYSPTGEGELRTKSFPKTAAPAAPNATNLSTWTLLVSGVNPRGASAKVFTLDTDLTKATVQFATFGEDTDSATIDFSTHLAPHPTYAPGSEPCS